MSGETPPPPQVFVRRVVRRSFVFHSPFFHPASGTRTTGLHGAPEVDRLALRQSFTCCRKSFDRRSSCVVRRMPADRGKFCSTSCVVHPNVRKSSDVEYVRLSFDILHASNARRTVCEYFCSYTGPSWNDTDTEKSIRMP